MARKVSKAKATKPASKKKKAVSARPKTSAKAAVSKAAVSKTAVSKTAVKPVLQELQMVTLSCPGDNCSITKPAPDVVFDPMESFEVWVADTYPDPIRVVGVWVKVLDAVPSDCNIPDTAISLLQDTSDKHLWKGFVMAPNNAGDYFLVAWVKIEKVDCKTNIAISVE